jgi:hypothetical protein
MRRIDPRTRLYRQSGRSFESVDAHSRGPLLRPGIGRPISSMRSRRSFRASLLAVGFLNGLAATPTAGPDGQGPTRRRPAGPDPGGDYRQRPGPEKGETTPVSPLIYFAHPASTIRNVPVAVLGVSPWPCRLRTLDACFLCAWMSRFASGPLGLRPTLLSPLLRSTPISRGQTPAAQSKFRESKRGHPQAKTTLLDAV